MKICMKKSRRLLIGRLGALVLALAVLLAFSFLSPLETYGTVDVLQIQATGAYLLKQESVPSYGMVGGDWAVIGLARSGLDLPATFSMKYLVKAEKALKDSGGELSRNKYSEYSRMILGLTAVGKNPKDVGGYNLMTKLSDLASIEKQGINGPIYALLALDSLGYDSLLREELIGSIVKRELAGGGFSLSGAVADPDVTAAALQALSKYKARTEVKAVIERALSALSLLQLDTGGFAGWAASGVENAESIAQVILALTALGIDPYEDSRFIKKDNNGYDIYLLDALASFRLADGSYSHLEGQGADLMATEQAFMAVVALDRFYKGKNHIFRMGDISGSKYYNKVLLNGEYLNFDVEPVITGGRTLVPMRAIFEALGATVDWDGNLRQVRGHLNDKNVSLFIGKTTAYVNGIAITLDVAPQIKNGRTLVPLRFVSESLGADVGWDKNTRTAIVDLR